MDLANAQRVGDGTWELIHEARPKVLVRDCFFFQAVDGIRDGRVTGVQTCALPICLDLPGLDGQERILFAPECSTAKRMRSWPSRPGRSRRATSSSSGTKARGAGRECARCSTSPARCKAPASAPPSR